MITSILRRTAKRMMLMDVLRRLLFVPAATVLLFAWIIGAILSPVLWPIVWIATGRNIYVKGHGWAMWLEEQVERILPE